MSNLHTCTSTTRPSSPNQGDMLFETDSNKLILYYNGAWLTFGASAQASSTVLSIDIGVGVESDITTYFETRYAGDWFLNTSKSIETPMCIKHSKGVYKYATPGFDASFDLFERQFVPGELKVGIADVGTIGLTIDDVNEMAMAITPRGDIVIPNHAKNQHTMIFIKSPKHVQPEYDRTNSSNIVMQSDTSSVTLNATYPEGTLVVTQYNQTETHVGFAGDSEFYGNKDIPTGVFHIDQSSYTAMEGPKSYVSKVYRDTQNQPVSAGPLTYVHQSSPGMENNKNNYVTTIWFKLSATDPVVEQGNQRFLYGLNGHSTVFANSAADGSGWYLSNGWYFNDQIPENSQTKLEEGEWYNLTISVSAEPEVLPSNVRDARVYLNGDLVHTTTTIGGTYIRNIGVDGKDSIEADHKNQHCMNGHWVGYAVWNTTLSEQQIDIIANNTNIISFYPQIPEPFAYYHPLLDPIKMFGAYDNIRNVVSYQQLLNQTPVEPGSTTLGTDAFTHYQHDYYLVDRDGYEIFSQDATIYSEEHPTK